MEQKNSVEMAMSGIEKFQTIEAKMNAYFLESSRLIHMVMLGMIGQFIVAVLGGVGLA